LVGSIDGRSSLKIAHFVSIHQQIWPPEAIHFSDWLVSKKIFMKKKILYLGKWFQRRRYLEIDQSETRIACGGHACY
jgi:hypothetical protein